MTEMEIIQELYVSFNNAYNFKVQYLLPITLAIALGLIIPVLYMIKRELNELKCKLQDEINHHIVIKKTQDDFIERLNEKMEEIGNYCDGHEKLLTVISNQPVRKQWDMADFVPYLCTELNVLTQIEYHRNKDRTIMVTSDLNHLYNVTYDHVPCNIGTYVLCTNNNIARRIYPHPGTLGTQPLPSKEKYFNCVIHTISSGIVHYPNVKQLTLCIVSNSTKIDCKSLYVICSSNGKASEDEAFIGSTPIKSLYQMQSVKTITFNFDPEYLPYNIWFPFDMFPNCTNVHTNLPEFNIINMEHNTNHIVFH